MLSPTAVVLAVLALTLSSPLAGAHDTVPFGSEGHHLAARALTSASAKAMFANSPKTYPALDVSGPAPRSQWTAAYNKAKKAGKIPNIPHTTVVDYNPQYPASYKGNPCNFYTTKCNAPGDIHRAPAGVAGISFDDGPQPPSVPLLTYLSKQKQKATHFLIGSRVVSNPTVMKQTIASGGHLAVHTWSHPYMTSMTDTQVLGELGWTIQAIYDQSGKIPKYWRPSYGDVDNRVRAIAKEVFGLTTVTWTEDTRDWCLADSAGSGSVCGKGNGPQNAAELDAELASFIRKPLSSGLLILEHSIGARQVAAFKKAYVSMKKRGWKPKAIPDMSALPWYQ